MNSDKTTYQLFKTNRTLMVMYLLASFAAMMVVAVIVYRVINKNDYTNIIGYIFFSLIPAIFLFTRLRPLYSKKINVELSPSHLFVKTASGKEIFNNPLSEVHTMMKMVGGENVVIKVWDRSGREFLSLLINLITSKKTKAETLRFFEDLITATHAVKGTTKSQFSLSGHPGDYYHSTIGSGFQELTPSTFHKKNKSSVLKKVLIGVAVFMLLSIGSIYLGSLSKGNYSIDENDVVSYNGKIVNSCNGKEFRPFSYHTGKDSAHVFYKGVMQENLDAKTFKGLGQTFFMDKNGVYKEPTWGWFSKTLDPLKGIDNATFRNVGSDIFADKNHVYTIDVFASNPLEPLTGNDAPDAATVSHVKGDESGVYFFKDKSAVYFKVSMGKVKRCNEIDADSFECLTWQVYKDKNKVYYTTAFLEQSEKGGDHKKNGYDILQGADAPSFTRIDDDNFVDKNTKWSISAKGEDRSSVPTQGRSVK